MKCNIKYKVSGVDDDFLQIQRQLHKKYNVVSKEENKDI